MGDKKAKTIEKRAVFCIYVAVFFIIFGHPA
jgi:hypothetical protein